MTELTIPEGSGDVILSYVRRKSAEWTTAQLVQRVQEGVARLEAAARAVPAAHLTLTPPGEEWSPLFCLQHVLDINRGTASRCRGVAATGTLPAAPPPPVPADRDQALLEHATYLDSVSDLVMELPARHFLEITWPHPFLGALNWREWFLTIRVHCLAHADQIEAMTRALAE